MRRLACVLVLAATAAHARPAQGGLIAVLEFKNKLEGPDRKLLDASYFTDQVRQAIKDAVPQLGVITRENVMKIVQAQGKSLEQCESKSGCEVETGQLLGADYVVTGELLKVGSSYKLGMRLYKTASSEMLAGATASGKSADALDEATGTAVLKLLAHLPRTPAAEGRISAPDDAPALAGAEEVVVRLDSTPPGAVVMLDGQLLCRATPCSKSIAVGVHEIAMQKEGYEPASARPEIKKGTAVALTLTRVNGLLSVDTTPPGLGIAINGKPEGKAPLVSRELPPGAYEVVIDDRCYLREGERVALEKGQDRLVRIAGRPRLAGLKLAAEDDAGNALDGKAFVDGRELGDVPGQFTVPLCSKELVVASGERRFAAALALQEKQIVAVRAVLPLPRAAPPEADGTRPVVPAEPLEIVGAGPAGARFAALERSFADFLKIHFNYTKQSDLVFVLKIKNARLKKLLDGYGDVIKQGDAAWTVAALCRIGEAYANFEKRLMDAPTPRGLSAEEQDVYRSALEQQAFPLEDKAVEALQKALEAGKSGVAPEWTARAEKLMRELKPDWHRARSAP